MDAWLPSTVRSSTPVMAKSWGEFQLVVVNVSVAGATDASVASEPASEMVTSAVGFESRTTCRVSVEPDSDTVTTRVETVNPEVSSSTVVTVTDSSSRAA